GEALGIGRGALGAAVGLLALDLGKAAIGEALAMAVERLLDALDLDEVGTEADDHAVGSVFGEASPSPVSVFDRSTLSRRGRGMEVGAMDEGETVTYFTPWMPRLPGLMAGMAASSGGSWSAG